jgi:hypothetical protein
MSRLGITPNLNRGNRFENYPRVRFYPEFLAAPPSHWVVDWSGTVLLYPEPVIPDALRRGRLFANQVMKGCKVKHVATGRVWILTGEYQHETNTYTGVWPD